MSDPDMVFEIIHLYRPITEDHRPLEIAAKVRKRFGSMEQRTAFLFYLHAKFRGMDPWVGDWTLQYTPAHTVGNFTLYGVCEKLEHVNERVDFEIGVPLRIVDGVIIGYDMILYLKQILIPEDPNAKRRVMWRPT